MLLRSLIIICFCLPVSLSAQKQKADSLLNLLSNERTDTGKVKLMWNLAGVINVNDPESAVLYAQKALALATELKYTEGQSKSLGALANTFIKMGNYTKALE